MVSVDFRIGHAFLNEDDRLVFNVIRYDDVRAHHNQVISTFTTSVVQRQTVTPQILQSEGSRLAADDGVFEDAEPSESAQDRTIDIERSKSAIVLAKM
jgi:hypothetical protein